MSFTQRVALQNAVIARLRADVATGAAADGSDIPVRDRAMNEPPEIYIRI
ncbi:MAG: hypothetical protein JKY31_13495, partial [Rhodobacteraceae bacterium]|nr:hypothetical protein [Paracoccaceae bacterium]